MAELSGPLAASLALVAEQAGDPTAQVYERLFAARPDLEPLFVGDVIGQARGQMLAMVLETLTELADGKAWASNMIRAERVNHDQLGVPDEAFGAFFTVVHETFRDLGGDAWTDEMEAAWTQVIALSEAR